VKLTQAERTTSGMLYKKTEYIVYIKGKLSTTWCLQWIVFYGYVKKRKSVYTLIIMKLNKKEAEHSRPEQQ